MPSTILVNDEAGAIVHRFNNVGAEAPVQPTFSGSFFGTAAGFDAAGVGSSVYVAFAIEDPGTDDVPENIVITGINVRVTVATTAGLGDDIIVACLAIGVYSNTTGSNPTGTLISVIAETGLTLSRDDFFTPATDTVSIATPFSVAVVPQAISGTPSVDFTDVEVEIVWELLTEFTVDPAVGGIFDETEVTITGAGFDAGVTGVTFDGDAATDVVVVDDETLTCTTPVGSAGIVDVVITYTDTSTHTITDGYEYVTYGTAPVVNGGPGQVLEGPAPSTGTTAATVTRGINNGTLTYAWAQVTGASGITIVSPTAINTDITFDDFVEGTYIFELTVTTEGPDPPVLVSTGVASFVMQPTVGPRVTGGSVQTTWPDDVTLTPVVTDDDWGGSLTYEWTQVSGPDTATIVSPTALSTDISFDEVTGVYIFRITVTRDGDDLSGSALWRVTVYTDDENTETENTGLVTMTANSIDMPEAIINSVHIEKNLNTTPRCSFTLYNVDVELYNEIVLSRGGVRLFGGVCMSTDLSFDENQPFFQPTITGFAWHLRRKTVTVTYTSQSMSDIVANLLTLAPGSITGDFIASGLPMISIVFTDKFVADCLDLLAQKIPGAHWSVDDYKRMHFASLETGSDPLALSAQHPFWQSLSLSRDGAGVVNRVKMHHTVVTTKPIPVNGEIQVSSLEGYSPSGGTTTIDGNIIHYTGTLTRLLNSVLSVQVIITRASISVDDSDLDDTFLASYRTTLTTGLGETTTMSGFTFSMTGGDNAVSLRVNSVLGEAAIVARITGINLYRVDNTTGGGTSHFVCQLNPRGGQFIDTLNAAHLSEGDEPIVNTADETAFYLTGCTGTLDVRTNSTVTVNDTVAQAALAAQLGGSDDGVVEAILEGGDISAVEATAAATAYIAAFKDPRVEANFVCRDDNATVGQIQSFNFPAAPVDFIGDLKIQSSNLSGFEFGVPHLYSVKAARDLVTIEDLLKKNPNK